MRETDTTEGAGEMQVEITPEYKPSDTQISVTDSVRITQRDGIWLVETLILGLGSNGKWFHLEDVYTRREEALARAIKVATKS